MKMRLVQDSTTKKHSRHRPTPPVSGTSLYAAAARGMATTYCTDRGRLFCTWIGKLHQPRPVRQRWCKHSNNRRSTGRSTLCSSSCRRESDRPSLLFLNLPESVESQDPPSTADRALERIRGRAIPLLPLFGVSGCGKTRTTIEMLSKNWGFYFNGSGTDWGSNDLFSFLKFVQDEKRYRNRDLESNIHVHILALALVLARIMILDHCLNIAESEGTTFTCKHWMLLQVCFRAMGVNDLFTMLLMEIADMIHLRSVGIQP
ncbi:hypothetical protein B0O80DRAFT_264622 [Mortierella sp. GBAus27b]|nr:hypothetical protein B0O80DRAFT_264622 [Mortierella sp. GBAus27b]